MASLPAEMFVKEQGKRKSFVKLSLNGRIGFTALMSAAVLKALSSKIHASPKF